MHKKLAVVIAGPPHSGKSVFTQQLRRLLLPLGCVGILEGCPDGEGGWANVTDASLVSALRRKGKFTQSFVDGVIQDIQESPMPIILVDVGGVRSPENERIFQACNGLIVVANPAKDGELVAWEEFGKANGCEPIALLDSLLCGDTRLDSVDGPIRGVQTGLERGQRVDGPVIEAVVNRLLDMIGRPQLSPGEAEATINFGRIASALGIPEPPGSMGFRPWHASAVRALAREGLDAAVTRAWGGVRAWVATLAAVEAKAAEVYAIRVGYVPIPELTLAAAPSGQLTWSVSEVDGQQLVSFEIPGNRLDACCLPEIQPPAVVPDATVVLSGRGPHWLTAAVARAYARAGHSVAVLALHESTELLPDGRTWAEAQPGFAPAVMVAGPPADLGRLLAVRLPQ
jgi:hypothetical protein